MEPVNERIHLGLEIELMSHSASSANGKRRGGRGPENHEEILRGSMWSTVTRAQRNAFLGEMARAGASLRALQDLVRPPLSRPAIAKILAGENVDPRSPGRSHAALELVITGIGPVDALRQVACSIVGLTLADIVAGTGLSDWAIRQLLMGPLPATRGVLRQVRTLEAIASAYGYTIGLRRPRGSSGRAVVRELSVLVKAVFDARAAASSWSILASATGETQAMLRRVLTGDAGIACIDTIDAVASFLHHELTLVLLPAHSISRSDRKALR